MKNENRYYKGDAIFNHFLDFFPQYYNRPFIWRNLCGTSFYIHNKKQELIQSSISIQQAYSQDGITGLRGPLQECAAQNTTVLVYCHQIQQEFYFFG